MQNYSKYDSAQTAYTEYVHTIGNPFLTFAVWLERMKQQGKYWGA